MKNALTELLDEINERLGPQLRELGVEAKAKRLQGGQIVAFEAKDRYVPLDIMITGSVLLPGTPLRLESCTAFFERWAAVEVGSDGWTFYEHMNNASYRFTGDIENDFAQLSGIIAKIGVVRYPSIENKVTKNQNLAVAFEAIADRLSLYGEFKIHCSSGRKGESLEFDDASDRKWRFEFGKSRVKVLIDGKTAGLFDPADRHGMLDLITARIQEDIKFSSRW
ncbi:hypothetical protein [Rhizobium leguminosarum]|uniref:hypothetical protein n=1 Tax=Rhizobium leguminosarum TaxID=384 RepID=UPI001C93CCCE|nr:hypothetical protein [Rhizobium leguminosarum]MBY5370452.1 hypothetical protein [Rhizobium leguminosarum]